jgi:hypothetical protein
MTVPATISDIERLQTRMAGAIGRQLPAAIERLGWSAGQLAGFQRDRLRALLARATECSPFHAERLRGIDPSRFELADLPRLPVLTKAQLMADFDRASTDRRLTRALVERHLAGSATDPSLLLGEYLCLVSGGSSGLRGLSCRPSASTPNSPSRSCAGPWPRPSPPADHHRMAWCSASSAPGRPSTPAAWPPRRPPARRSA